MDEQALIASARKGDARAFNQLVLLYREAEFGVESFKIISIDVFFVFYNLD